MHGEWTITPPLNGKELRAIPLHGLDVFIRVDETERDIDGDVVTVKQGAAVVPLSDDEYKAYDIVDHLNRVLRAISADREVTGEIVRVGEESGDVERYLPSRDTGTVKTEQAVLTWPDGTDVHRSYTER